MSLFYKIENKTFINYGVDMDMRNKGCHHLGKKIHTYEGKGTLCQSYEET